MFRRCGFQATRKGDSPSRLATIPVQSLFSPSGVPPLAWYRHLFKMPAKDFAPAQAFRPSRLPAFLRFCLPAFRRCTMTVSAPNWGSGEEFFGPRHAYRLHLLLKLRPRMPGLCLDAACGLGTLSEKLRAYGFKPVGMDLDFGAAMAAHGKGFPVVIGRMEHLPFKSESIPAFFSSETLEHLPDFKPAVEELVRVLRPGGSLILSVPANQKYWSAWDDWAGHQRRFDPKTLADDFKPLKLQRAFFPGFPLLLMYEKLFLRGFVKKRAEGKVEAKGKWGILKSLLSGPLTLLFRLNLPVKSKATGIVAKFIK